MVRMRELMIVSGMENGGELAAVGRASLTHNLGGRGRNRAPLWNAITIAELWHAVHHGGTLPA